MKNKKFALKNDWFYLIIIIISTFFMFIPHIIRGKTTIIFDMAIIGVPISQYINFMGQSKEFFFWNPYVYSGLPSFASSMGTLYYPLNIFFLFLNPLKHMFSFFLIHQILAGILGYWYLKKHNFKSSIALGASLLFSFSSSRIQMMPTIEDYGILTFSPLILICIDNLVEKISLKSIIFLSFSLSLLVLSGGINLLFIYMPIFILYGIWTAYHKKILFKFKTITSILLIIIITTLLSSALLYPLLGEFAPLGTTRNTEPLTFEQVTIRSISLKSLLLMPFNNFYGNHSIQGGKSLVFPYEHTYIPGFLGILMALLAYAFARKKRKNILLFFLFTFFIGFFFALGKNNPIFFYLYKYFSFFKSFRVSSRYFIFFPILILYISAAGMENLFILIRAKGNLILNKIKWGFFIFCIIYLILFSIYGYTTLFNTTFLILSILPCLIPLWVISNKKVVFVLLIFSIFLTMAQPLILVDKFFFGKKRYFKREISFLRNIKKSTKKPFDKIFYALNGNSPQMVGLYNISGASSINLTAYNEYFYTTLQQKILNKDKIKIMTYMNFHPIVVLSDGQVMANNMNSSINYNWNKIYLKKLKNNPMYKMMCPVITILPNKYYIEDNPYPRLWISNKYKIIKEKSKIFKALLNKNYKPEEFIILSSSPHKNYINLKSNINNTIIKPKIVLFKPDRIEISLNKTQGWLTLSDIYYPGWKAFIDHKERPIYKGNYIFRTIPILKKDKKLVLIYKAQKARKGIKISLITFLILTLILIKIELTSK